MCYDEPEQLSCSKDAWQAPSVKNVRMRDNMLFAKTSAFSGLHAFEKIYDGRKEILASGSKKITPRKMDKVNYSSLQEKRAQQGAESNLHVAGSHDRR